MSLLKAFLMSQKTMPSRYQEVEYIESTGTQWIDTGIIGDNNTGLYIDVQYIETGSYIDTVCIGSKVYNTDTRFFIGMAGTGFYFGWNILGNRPSANYNRNILSLNFFNDKKSLINNTLVDNITGNLANQNTNICLFACGYSPTPLLKSSVKIYNAKITDGSTLVRNFVPVYDTLTQKYGMWESVQGKFYGNDGTGDFKGSIVGYTIVGSPTIVDGVVSGFSANDYLTLPIFAPTGRWKFIVGFTYSSQNTGTCYIAGNVDSFLVKTYNNALQVALKVNGSSSFDFSASIGKTLSDGEKCYCSIEFTGTIYKFSWSSDGINWTLGNTYISTTNIRTNRGIYYGRVSNTVWLGTIIIKDSLIYQNNKLWFNGQEG